MRGGQINKESDRVGQISESGFNTCSRRSVGKVNGRCKLNRSSDIRNRSCIWSLRGGTPSWMVVVKGPGVVIGGLTRIKESGN